MTTVRQFFIANGKRLRALLTLNSSLGVLIIEIGIWPAIVASHLYLSMVETLTKIHFSPCYLVIILTKNCVTASRQDWTAFNQSIRKVEFCCPSIQDSTSNFWRPPMDVLYLDQDPSLASIAYILEGIREHLTELWMSSTLNFLCRRQMRSLIRREFLSSSSPFQSGLSVLLFSLWNYFGSICHRKNCFAKKASLTSAIVEPSVILHCWGPYVQLESEHCRSWQWFFGVLFSVFFPTSECLVWDLLHRFWLSMLLPGLVCGYMSLSIAVTRPCINNPEALIIRSKKEKIWNKKGGMK